MKQIIDESISTVPKEEQKKHIGNLKLSTSGKAIKVHFFEPEIFFVIPLQEITKSLIGKVYQYIDGEPEIVGEIESPKNGKKHYIIKAKGQFYYLKKTYVDLMVSGSRLTLNLMEGE